MKRKYDFVFLTNTPSFYKINLCNQIACTHSVLLILYGYGSEAVNTTLKDSESYHFDYVFLHEGPSERRNKFITFCRLMKLMCKLQYRKVLYSGWFVPEYNLCSFLIPKHKNCVVCESSNIESSFTGIRGFIKKCIIGRMKVALPSGELQKAIFTALGFEGAIFPTGGVGIFNKLPRLMVERRHENKKYLYVGRLTDCKNLHFLIEEFNRTGKQLTIVGTGELEDELKALAHDNITFLGFIRNEQLKDIYLAHDIFVLPSKSEVWGLVLEEAIYWGLPVIVSDHVGSYKDLVVNSNTGCVFQLGSSESFDEAMNTVESNYDDYCKAVQKVDFDKRDIDQVAAYIQALNS